MTKVNICHMTAPSQQRGLAERSQFTRPTPIRSSWADLSFRRGAQVRRIAQHVA
jgi:hypothetical protein